jgi:putative SOS response-associated peptidase YedK
MCGRVALYSPPARLAAFLRARAGLDFTYDDRINWTEGRPSWNVGPQRRLYGVHEVDGTRILERSRWGLVPSWAKDPKIGNKLFNARGETVAEKPSFPSAFAKRPLVIPVDAFYEWDHRPGKNKQPNLFTRVDGNPLLLAGLFDYSRAPDDKDSDLTVTCTIITTEPNDDMDEIHNRMPVVLELDDVDVWPNVDEHPTDERSLLLSPSS